MANAQPKARIDHGAVMVLVRQNLKHQDIADRFGISRGRVSAIAREHGHNTRAVQPQRKAQSVSALAHEDAILAMLLTGASRSATARAIGASYYAVERVVAKHRAHHPILSDPKHGAKPPPPKAQPVPAWARLAGLADDYHDHARIFGDIEAARHCRALKREADPHSLASVTGRGR